MTDNTIHEELRPALEDVGNIKDFDKHRNELTIRAQKWMEYKIQDFDEEKWFNAVVFSQVNLLFPVRSAWAVEQSWFPTNKPRAHEALFFERAVEWLTFRAGQLGYLQFEDYDGTLASYTLSPNVIAYFRMHWQGAEWLDKDVRFKYPDLKEFREKEKQEKEIFPEPEPLRVEVAGSIISFTTWDAVMVVYMNCSHKGKEVRLECKGDGLSLDLTEPIIERFMGSTTICAAIFPRIPLVTDFLRHLQKSVKRLDCTVRFANLEETVTLFRENVTELDWRGR